RTTHPIAERNAGCSLNRFTRTQSCVRRREGWGPAKGGVGPGEGRGGAGRWGSARVGGCVCQYGCAMTERIATNAANTALLTDRYELTMLQAALADGTASRRCVFEVFTRRLPPGRRYGVVAGTGRVLEALKTFRFTDTELEFLRRETVVNSQTLDFLADYRFTGNIYGYAEGEVFFPGSPLMV